MNPTITVCDLEPLVAVIVTGTVSAIENVQERVAIPGPFRLVGAILHALLSSVNITEPLNPLKATTARLDAPVVPTLTETEAGFAAREKSCTMKSRLTW